MPIPGWRIIAGTLTSVVLLALFARGGIGHLLGFIALVPWLLALDAARGPRAGLLAGWLMAVAFTVGVLGWFAAALDAYTGIGLPFALLLLALAAPLLQPQFLLFALVRAGAGARHGPAIGALAGACAWLACEWLWPKLLGDTLGHGLAPATLLRQAADLGGAAGLTLALLACNEALAAGWRRRRDGPRRLAMPLVGALAVPFMLATYGAWRLDSLRAHAASPAPTLRIAMVQASITDYEARRADVGAYAVVREVLDAHLALSRAALAQHGAEAILWSETVYPTPFGQPRSADGAAFDREILDFVDAAGVSLVFGTYERDATGEYNAAAFVEPGRGLLGFYRKTHLFPLTEYVPPWLDRPWLRRLLPWTGTWRAGNGPRVFPLRAADGRELQVLPLVCLDDVRPMLAIEGTRLGAQAIVGLSNDAWFSRYPLGAALHLTVASFRSVETRLPQLRVTTNGLSAFIDPSGEVLARSAMGDRAVLAGEVPVRDPPPTLVVRWGDWVGGAALGLLALLVLLALLARGAVPAARPAYPVRLALLGRGARAASVLLRLLAAAALVWLGLRMLLHDGLQVNSLLQVQGFLLGVALPCLAAAAVRRINRATATISDGRLVLQQGARRIEIPLASIARIHPWRWPLPGPGLELELASGRRWPAGFALSDPDALVHALRDAGARAELAAIGPAWARDHARARAAARHPWLDHAGLKFGLFPLLLALPAFRLHQYIAFGGTFGEWQTHGASAWLLGLGVWWTAWSLGLMLCAALLRMVIEVLALAAALHGTASARRMRLALERFARFACYAGVPAWLGWRLLAA
jgi:apolipoprotein N-acyltransferase